MSTSSLRPVVDRIINSHVMTAQDLADVRTARQTQTDLGELRELSRLVAAEGQGLTVDADTFEKLGKLMDQPVSFGGAVAETINVPRNAVLSVTGKTGPYDTMESASGVLAGVAALVVTVVTLPFTLIAGAVRGAALMSRD